MREVQLCEAKAKLSALVEEAAQGETAVITRHGKPRAIILGVDEWNRLRRVPSFGRLLLSSPLEDGDLPPRAPQARHGTPHCNSPLQKPRCIQAAMHPGDRPLRDVALTAWHRGDTPCPRCSVSLMTRHSDDAAPSPKGPTALSNRVEPYPAVATMSRNRAWKGRFSRGCSGNSTSSRHAHQVRGQALLGVPNRASHSRQQEGVRAGQDAQSRQRSDDRLQVRLGELRRKSRPGRSGDGVSVRGRRALLLHEHRDLRADPSHPGGPRRSDPVPVAEQPVEGAVLRGPAVQYRPSVEHGFESGRDRAEHQGSHRHQCDETCEARDGTCGAGAALHQGRRDDPGQHHGRNRVTRAALSSAQSLGPDKRRALPLRPPGRCAGRSAGNRFRCGR